MLLLAWYSATKVPVVHKDSTKRSDGILKMAVDTMGQGGTLETMEDPVLHLLYDPY